MDINFWLQRQQIALMQAASAKSPEARIAHRGRASCYASRLRKIGYAMPVFGAAN